MGSSRVIDQQPVANSLTAAMHIGLVAAEFGFKGMERGWNLERTLAEYRALYAPPASAQSPDLSERGVGQ